ncbi:MAG: LPS export ABC transporter permease LptF [Thermoanaerobaculia bacterium]
MKRLDRYVFRETLTPLVLGLLIYTCILLVRFLFISAEMIIERGVSLGTVGRMVMATLPNILVLTLPMSLLFGLLTAVGRLASDSELVAMRASGVSLLSLYRPILLLSVLLMGINLWVSLYALPWGNSELQKIRLEILSQSVARQVEPRIFYDEWEEKILYVFSIDRTTQEWQGVFLADKHPANDTEVTLAEKGRIRVDESGERVVLELENAEKHVVNLTNPQRYQKHHYDHVEFVLDESFTSRERARLKASRGVRELTVPELRKWIKQREIPLEQRNLAEVEMHKKFAIPVACLVFGLFALPLGFNNRRGGKTSGFALSMLVILLYYLLINSGEEAARYGRLPSWIAMWSPNLLLGALGLILLWRRNRDRPLLPQGLGLWLRSRRSWLPWRKKAPAGAATRGPAEASPAAVTVILPRLRLRFPNLLDRYTLRVFGSTVLLVLASLMLIYILFDFAQLFDEVLKNKVPRGVILNYYFLRSFQIFCDTVPFVTLVSTLVTFALLSKTSEVTAVKALGVSLYRLSVPVVLASLGLALLGIGLQLEVTPATNRQAQLLLNRIKGGDTNPGQIKQADRWLRAKDGRIYNFLHFDPKAKSLQRLQIFELENEHQLRQRTVANLARFNAAAGEKPQWLLSDGWIRRFDAPPSPIAKPGNGSRSRRKTPEPTYAYAPFKGPQVADLSESPDFFASEIRRPGQMGYLELSRYIDELRQSGQPVPDLEVELQSKLAFPAVAFVMALVALPFAFRLGRQGTLYGIGVSIALAMVFITVMAIFSALGKAEVLPAIAAVWSPSALFGTLAGYLFLGVRS